MQTSFYFHETDSFPYRPINSIWLIIYSTLSCIFFFITDRTTKSLLTNKHRNNHKDKWLQQNTLISFIHSTISSILLIIAVIRAPEMFDDPLSHINHFNYALIAFSIGYFFYDFYECLRNSTSSVFAILGHHIIVISFFVHILLRTRNIGYGLYALSLEINSVFLHARRLLRWFSPISSTSISFNKNLKLFIDICNYITFIMFRFGTPIIGLEKLFSQSYRVSPIIWYFTVFCVSSILLLNIILFHRLIMNQFIRKSKTKHYKANEDNLLMTDNHVLIPS